MIQKNTSVPPAPSEDIFPEPLSDALSKRYLAYALSTITARALPDVRDGLKPVHRRILYAMRQMRLSPDSAHKKSARVVGDVIGKYHPHGDQSIYDALVRLAQDFAARYPLVDGQGNFGNVDGDNPAAMRYTESRMTDAAILLLEGIDDDTVDFRENYDGQDVEPVVLPAAFPNLLANGASGIAVGMATSIPPHNIIELIDACLHIIKSPNASAQTLVQKYVQGPDFPTGGILVEPEQNIIEAYATGKGSFRVRAKWEKEDLGRGKYQIVIHEIPFQVQKSRLIERIAELIQSKAMPVLTDVRDESTQDIRLVLEPRSGNIDPVLLMETVFKKTDLETKFSLNLNVLDTDGIPRVMSLRETLQAFLNHRQSVLLRQTRFRLEKIANRLETLEGYLIAYLNLDEIIRIIRYEDEPKKELISAFALTDIQAEAILNMRLRSLRKLEEIEIKKERAALRAEQKELKNILKSEDAQWQNITTQLRNVKKIFAAKPELSERRSHVHDTPEIIDVDINDLIEKEPVTIVLSDKGWVRTMKGHAEDVSTIKYKEADKAAHVLHAMTTDKIILLGTNGKFYTLAVKDLPGGRGHGEPVRLMVDLANDENILSVFVYTGERVLLLASTAGHGFFVKEQDCLATTRKGKQVLNLAAGARVQVCRLCLDNKLHKDTMVAAVNTQRKLLVFPAQDLPIMTRGKGVQLQRFTNAELADVTVFDARVGLTWTDPAGRTQSAGNWKDWFGKRAQAGKAPPKGFPRSGRFGA